MYIWMFGILNWVTYGRTWDELEDFLNLLEYVLNLGEVRLPVYVHNLGYEFQFIRKRFDWDDVFFLEERKPIYARTTNGVEFRCSWKLSSKSLENTAKDLNKYKVEKKVGDLDYQLVRTSKTALTELELGYCENDIRVILAYIQEKIEQDGDVTKIPMTNTGYVRNFCREKCFTHYKKYARYMSALTLRPEEYIALRKAFAGGFTHANAHYVGKTLYNVGSFDFTSSYPAVMLSEKFPMSQGRLVDSITDDNLYYYLDSYCCIIDVTFMNLVPKVDIDHPLSVSKLEYKKGVVSDNGRVVTALEARTTCTEQDFFTYGKFYSWDNIVIHSFMIYDKAYLPKDFCLAIIDMYKKKTILKGIKEEIINYMISKNMLNASFGMTVTDIVRAVVKYVDDSFVTTKPDLKSAINKYNNSRKRFLFYPWGVWVTAYARANLFSGILACGKDYVYSDTDSIKVLNPENHMDYINAYNENIWNKLSAAAEFHNLPIEDFAPFTQKGIQKPIGVWDNEGVYDRFKTLGAKRYIVEKDGEVEITVAGLHKGKAVEYMKMISDDPFTVFETGLYVPPEHSGRLTHTYIEYEIEGDIVDYTGVPGHYHELSCVHMEPSAYEMEQSPEFRAFLDEINMVVEDSW